MTFGRFGSIWPSMKRSWLCSLFATAAAPLLTHGDKKKKLTLTQGYQLSMTRALGHKMLAEHGVIFNPSVRRSALADGDFCLVLASDGVWDSFDDGEVVGMVARHSAEGLAPERVAARIARDAVRVSSAGPGCDADNTTIAVMML